MFGLYRKFCSPFRLLVLAVLLCGASLAHASTLPDPAFDPAPAAGVNQTIVLAGGCFWGMQGVFQHVKGVTQGCFRLCRRFGGIGAL